MSTAIPIRKASPEDAAEIHRFLASMLDAFPSFSAEARASYLSTWSEAGIKSRMETPGFLALKAGEKIAGVSLCAPPEGGVATLIWLLVDKANQGQGIGKALFTESCRFYKELGCHKLKLTAPSEEARKFYNSLGMNEEGFHPNHWFGADFWSFGVGL